MITLTIRGTRADAERELARRNLAPIFLEPDVLGMVAVLVSTEGNREAVSRWYLETEVPVQPGMLVIIKTSGSAQ